MEDSYVCWNCGRELGLSEFLEEARFCPFCGQPFVTEETRKELIRKYLNRGKAEDLTLEEAAKEMSWHRRTITRYIEQGTLSARKVGGRWRIRRKDLEEFKRGGR